MTLPNFLIIGAPKAGTTTFYDYFRAHPEIFMPALKEPNFFNYQGQADQFRFPVRTLEAYEALFADATAETAIGEASTGYLSSGFAARKIRDTVPGMRLIASLRNPVEQSFSAYQMNLRNGKMRGSFSEVLRSNPGFTRGYHRSLETYFGLFPEEQIRIVLFEDLARDPVGTAQSLFGFLGVAPDFVPDARRVSNPGGVPRIKFLHTLLASPAVRVTARTLLPETVIAKARELRARNLKKQGLTPEERAEAQKIFRDDILRTQDLIGRDLSAWLGS